MLVLSSVNWHFPFKTASLCEWAVGVGCLFSFFFFKPTLPQPMTSQSCKELGKEFYSKSQKKVKAFVENDILGVYFRVYRNREREREKG